MIDNNENIIIEHDEIFLTIFQGFKVTENRKWLITLKEIAAYNVAKYIGNESDISNLAIPNSLHRLVLIYLDTYLGDYRSAWFQNSMYE